MHNFFNDFRIYFIESDEFSWRLVSITFIYIFIKPSTILLFLFVH